MEDMSEASNQDSPEDHCPSDTWNIETPGVKEENISDVEESLEEAESEPRELKTYGVQLQLRTQPKEEEAYGVQLQLRTESEEGNENEAYSLPQKATFSKGPGGVEILVDQNGCTYSKKCDSKSLSFYYCRKKSKNNCEVTCTVRDNEIIAMSGTHTHNLLQDRVFRMEGDLISETINSNDLIPAREIIEKLTEQVFEFGGHEAVALMRKQPALLALIRRGKERVRGAGSHLLLSDKSHQSEKLSHDESHQLSYDDSYMLSSQLSLDGSHMLSHDESDQLTRDGSDQLSNDESQQLDEMSFDESDQLIDESYLEQSLQDGTVSGNESDYCVSAWSLDVKEEAMSDPESNQNSDKQERGGRATFTAAKQGGSTLWDEDGYSYCLNSKSSTKQEAWYHCRKRRTLGCRVTCKVNFLTNRIVVVSGEHAHDNDDMKQKVRTMEKKALDEAALNCDPPRAVISNLANEIMAFGGKVAVATMRKRAALARALRRKRVENGIQLPSNGDQTPSIPDTLEDQTFEWQPQTATFTEARNNGRVMWDEDGHCYRKVQQIDDMTARFVCRKRRVTGCNTRCVVKLDTNTIVSMTRRHIHEPDVLRTQVYRMEQRMIRQAADDPDTPAKVFVANFTQQIQDFGGDEAVASMRNVTALVRAIQRRRGKPSRKRSSKPTEVVSPQPASIMITQDSEHVETFVDCSYIKEEVQETGEQVDVQDFSSTRVLPQKGTFSDSKNEGKILWDEEGYSYNRNNGNETKAYFFCRKKRALGCRVTCILRLDTEEIVTISGEHNHEQDVLKDQVYHIEQEAIDRAAADSLRTSIKDVIADLTKQVEEFGGGEAVEMMRSRNALVRAIQRKRDKMLGKCSTPKVKSKSDGNSFVLDSSLIKQEVYENGEEMDQDFKPLLNFEQQMMPSRRVLPQKAIFTACKNEGRVLWDEEGYSYNKRSSKDETKAYFSCRKKRALGCRVTCIVRLDIEEIVSISGEHNHDIDVLKNQVYTIEQEAIDKAAESLDLNIKHVIDELTRQVEEFGGEEAVASMRKRTALIRAVQRKRDKILGKSSTPRAKSQPGNPGDQSTDFANIKQEMREGWEEEERDQELSLEQQMIQANRVLPQKATFTACKNEGKIMWDEEGHSYNKARQKDDTAYYQCRKRRAKGCKVTCVVRMDVEEIVSINGVHLHEMDVLRNQVYQIEQEAVNRAAQSPDVATKDVLDEMRQQVENFGGEEAVALMRTKTALSRAVQRKRDKALEMITGVKKIKKKKVQSTRVPQNAVFTPCRNDGSVLWDEDGYSYRKSRQKGDTTAYYVCRKKNTANCMVTCIVRLDSNEIVSITNEHVHDPDFFRNQVYCIEQEAIELSAENPDAPVANIIADLTQQIEDFGGPEAVNLMRTRNALIRAIQRKRDKFLEMTTGVKREPKKKQAPPTTRKLPLKVTFRATRCEGTIMLDEDGFAYNKTRVKDDNAAYFACRKKRANYCSVTCIARLDTNEIVSMTGDHNHDADVLRNQVYDMEQEAIEKAVDDSDDPPVTIIANLVEQIREFGGDPAVACMRKRESLARAIQRRRRKARRTPSGGWDDSYQGNMMGENLVGHFLQEEEESILDEQEEQEEAEDDDEAASQQEPSTVPGPSRGEEVSPSESSPASGGGEAVSYPGGGGEEDMDQYLSYPT